jgi:hypothetical protein
MIIINIKTINTQNPNNKENQKVKVHKELLLLTK